MLEHDHSRIVEGEWKVGTLVALDHLVLFLLFTGGSVKIRGVLGRSTDDRQSDGDERKAGEP